MNSFQITEIIDSHTVKVTPQWKFKLKDNSEITGNRIRIRGLDGADNNSTIIDRLHKLLINSGKEINFSAPELVNTSNHIDSIVSCTVHVAKTNILYFFPEFVYKD